MNLIFNRAIISWSFILLTFVCVTFSLSTEPPSITKQPKHQQLFQVASPADEAVKPFALECEATGNPEPKYSWIKNGVKFDPVAYDKRISQTSKRGSLTFSQPDSLDEGLYQCFAENIHGTAVSNAVFLRKSELASFPETDPEVKNVIEGEPLTIDCNPPTGYPKPTIYWMVQSKTGALYTINSSRLTVDPDGKLHFSNVTQDDQLHDSGAYTCSATSHFRSEYKFGRKVFLKVTSSGSSGLSSHPPKLQYTSPTSVTALRGQNLELHCIYGGTPLPDVVWRKNNSPLSGNRYNFLNHGKTLLITKVDFQDEDNYVCSASNGVGQVMTHSTRVQVLAAPYWKKVPNNTVAAEGETVTFSCEASGIPEPRLQWLINGKPLDTSPANNRRKLKGTTLTIENLIKTDTAVFQCNASNIHGYAFKNFYLNVLALPPRIIEKPAEVIKAVATHTAILRCRVFGAPKPEVRWLRDGIELTGGDYDILDEGDLKIKDLKYDYAGKYVCHAVNKLGEAKAEGFLEVKSKTEIINPPEDIEVAAGKVAVFRCAARADSSLDLQIVWSFAGRDIDFEQNQRMVKSADNSLSILKTRELDSGEYTCTAKTELDSVSAKATLIVQDVPNAPQIVAVECGKSTARIEWKPMGDNRAQILQYIIQYNTSFTPNVWDDHYSHVPAPDTIFQVSISPWANYTFRVIAVNKIGKSIASKHSEMCTTEEDIPHNNPKNVKGWGSAPDNMIISWTPMEQIEHNAPGFYYKVYWKREESTLGGFESVIINDWRQSSFKVNNTPTYKPYRIKVEAHNSRGQAHTVAPEVIGYSGEAKPSKRPENFHFIRTYDWQTAEFAWDPVPEDSINGRFEGYKIFIWNERDGLEKMREVKVNSNVTRAKINILKPNTLNKAQVMAFNTMYSGPGSDIVSVKTEEGPPGPVTNFDAIPMGKSALYLIWNQPEELNGELKGYKISYREVIGTELGDVITRDPITNLMYLKYKLAGLKPATKYRISIRAFTNGGEGEEYYIEENTIGNESSTIPDEPDFDYRIEEKDGTAVRVIWVPPLRSGKPGSSFYVQYRKEGEATYKSTPKEVDKEYIYLEGLDPNYNYEVRVVSVDGEHQTASRVKPISLSDEVPLGFNSYDNRLSDVDWLIGMLCAIALVIVLTVVVCIVKRNRGAKYSVHEKEAKKGRELDYGDHGGFNEYSKPSNAHLVSRASLNSSSKLNEAEDTDSMTDFGEDESSKFEEEGSFIGIYGAKSKTSQVQSPTGVATFV